MLAIRLVDSMVRICPVDKMSRKTERERKDLSPLTNYTASKQLSPLFTFGQQREAEMSIINQIFLSHSTNTHVHALIRLRVAISHVFNRT